MFVHPDVVCMALEDDRSELHELYEKIVAMPPTNVRDMTYSIGQHFHRIGGG